MAIASVAFMPFGEKIISWDFLYLGGDKVSRKSSKNDHGFLNIYSAANPALSAVNFFKAGNSSSGEDGHEGHVVFIADQAVKAGGFLVNEDNNIFFRKRRWQNLPQGHGPFQIHFFGPSAGPVCQTPQKFDLGHLALASPL